MDKSLYAVESALEENHWWFVGRRALLSSIINGIGFDKECKVLDVGTGTGTNMRMLSEMGYSNVHGIDLDEDAINFCRKKGFVTVEIGDANKLPFANRSFDLVLATDIIEHTDNDSLALSEVYRVLKTGGVAIVTVPAFRCLWGEHDIIAHHKRRYTRSSLVKLISKSKFVEKKLFYFNFILFLPILIVRKINAYANRPYVNENKINAISNFFLCLIFKLDVYIAKKFQVPFGVSIMAILHKSKS